MGCPRKKNYFFRLPLLSKHNLQAGQTQRDGRGREGGGGRDIKPKNLGWRGQWHCCMPPHPTIRIYWRTKFLYCIFPVWIREAAKKVISLVDSTLRSLAPLLGLVDKRTFFSHIFRQIFKKKKIKNCELSHLQLIHLCGQPLSPSTPLRGPST